MMVRVRERVSVMEEMNVSSVWYSILGVVTLSRVRGESDAIIERRASPLRVAETKGCEEQRKGKG